MCGENRASLETRVLEMGSPPRVRGKPRPKGDESSFGRITPACAGKTAQQSVDFLPRQDHPRVCGENKPFLSACHSR